MASQFYDRRNDGDDHFADGFAGFVEFRELPRRYRHTVDRALGDVEDGRQILDGAIEFEMKSTGIIFTSAYQGEGYPYATEVAPGLAAPAHQHLFSARQDMEVDGNVNAVDEIDVARCAVGPDNKHGIGVHQEITRLKTEGGRLADNNRGRVWRISNPGKTNRMGRPVATRSFLTRGRRCSRTRRHRSTDAPGSPPTTSG